MSTFAVLVELDEPVILSASSANAGGHECLNHVPGAVLLGSAASRLYSTLLPDDAFTVFHSGSVSIGDALPISSTGTITWPAPRSWHLPKGSFALRSAVAETIVDLAKAETTAIQVEQIRAGFVSPELEIVRPRKRRVVKSAIDPTTGRSADQQMFSYEALESGQRFVSVVHAIGGDGEPGCRALKEHFDRRRLRLGRSRSAEFGGVRTTVITRAPADPPRRAPQHALLSVWALSDLALTDQRGCPTLRPSGEQFGWPSAEIVWERTHLRSRIYTPFNAHWKRPMMDRVVIEAGSVITFAFKRNDDAKAAFRCPPFMVGLYREAGLGRISVGATFVGTGAIEATSDVAPWRLPDASPPTEVGRDHRATSSGEALVVWARHRANIMSARAQSVASIDTLVEELRALYATARRYNGVAAHERIGPSAAQWNAVGEMLKQAALQKNETRVSSLRTLTGDDGEGIAGFRDEAWSAKTGSGARDNFAGWLAANLGTEPDESSLMRLSEVAVRMARAVQEISP